MAALVELVHPDTGRTTQVSAPAARVLAKNGWVRTDDPDAEQIETTAIGDAEPSYVTITEPTPAELEATTPSQED